jgi:oligopeptide/dipeptide ABC transporter ATP-binding protein
MMALVEVRGLEQHYRVNRGGARRQPHIVRAIAGVDLDIEKGEFVGLVGESGSGKSTLGRGIIGATRPTGGQVHFHGIDVATSSSQDLQWLRREMQLVFQNPMLALNPRMTIAQTLAEHLYVQSYGPAHRIERRIAKTLDLCGLSQTHGSRYPHELSGGQRQRALIARAISGEAKFIVADEPVSALDVSTRAQIINVFRELHRELELTSLVISHDFTIVAHLCRRIAVMYLGRIVEIAPTATLLGDPQHPYSRALLAAVPTPDPRIERTRPRAILAGEPPNPNEVTAGCSFYPRCSLATQRCLSETPSLRALPQGAMVACHHAGATPNRYLEGRT